MPKLSEYKLTKEFVDSLPTNRDAVYFDARLTGFGVRTKPNGRKTYLIQYRNRSGESKKLSIGQHGAVTADEARRKARILLGRVADGEDPSGDRHDERKAETVEDVCRAYLAAALTGINDPKKATIRGKGGRPKKASTYERDKSRVERHILPLLGKRKARDLKPRDITKFISDVTLGKTAVDVKTKLRGRARVSGGAGVASRTVGLLGGIFTWAGAQGIIDSNPCRGVQRPPDKKRMVRLTDDQYAALGAALRASEAAGEPWQATDAIWMIALVGCRKSEVAKLLTDEIDAAGSALRLIDSKENESVRPIGRSALGIVKPRIGNHKYVFHRDSDPDLPYGGLPGAWKRVMARVDPEVTMPQLTLHGLRHAFASAAGDLGYSEITIAALIGHSSGSVTGGYIHALDSALIATADKVSAHILKMMNGD